MELMKKTVQFVLKFNQIYVIVIMLLLVNRVGRAVYDLLAKIVSKEKQDL